LYAVGKKALATDSSGALLQPKAVDELEGRYDTLLSKVTRLHREIANLNKRASVRPAPEGTVVEGEQEITSTMVAYSSALEHTVRMQIVWHRKQVEKAEQAALACQQLLRGQSGGGAPMAARVNAEEYDSSTGTQGASKKTKKKKKKKKKKKTPQFYAVAVGREVGGCSASASVFASASASAFASFASASASFAFAFASASFASFAFAFASFSSVFC
jgi:hypothetical protein